MSEQVMPSTKHRISHPLVTMAIIAIVVFSSLQVMGTALADSGQLAGCGAPTVFKSGGVGLSVGAMWWIGEHVMGAAGV